MSATPRTKPSFDRVAFSFEETAQQLGRHRCWVYRQVKAGRIRAIIGYGAAMIPASEIKRIVEGGNSAPASSLPMNRNRAVHA